MRGSGEHPYGTRYTERISAHPPADCLPGTGSGQADRRSGPWRLGGHLQLARRDRDAASRRLRRASDCQPAPEPDRGLAVCPRLPPGPPRPGGSGRAFLRRKRHHQRRGRSRQRQGAGLRRCDRSGARRNDRPAERRRSIITREKPSQLYFTTSYPGAPGGASELYLKENVFVNYFAGDLPRSRARLLWASQRGASTAAFTTPSTAAAWKTIPSWYFISTGDQIVTEASELKMAHRAHSHITMFRGGSHLTLISDPNAVTAVITSAICSRH